MSIISDILAVWTAASEMKGQNKEGIAVLLDAAANEATELAEEANRLLGEINYPKGRNGNEAFRGFGLRTNMTPDSPDAKLQGHCAALEIFYKKASSVVDIPQTLDTLVFHLGGIIANPIGLKLYIRESSNWPRHKPSSRLSDNWRDEFVDGSFETKPREINGEMVSSAGSVDTVALLSSQAGELRAFAVLYRAAM